MARNGV